MRRRSLQISGDGSPEDGCPQHAKPNEAKERMKCFESHGRFVFRNHKLISEGLAKIIRHAAVHPVRYIVCVVAVSIALPVAAFLTGSFNVEMSSDVNAVPQSSYSIKSLKWIRGKSGFPSTGWRPIVFLVHAGGSNVLGFEGARRVFDVLDAVRNTDGYMEICSDEAKNSTNSKCKLTSITEFWPESNRKIFDESVSNEGAETNVFVDKDDVVIKKLSSPHMADGTVVSREALFGNIKVSERNSATLDKIISSSSFRTVLYTPPDQKFEREAVSVVLALREEWTRESSNFRVEIYTKTAMDDELVKPITEDLPLVYSSFLMMATYTAFVFARFRKNKYGRRFVSSHALLGVGAAVTVVLSMATGYGFCALCQVPITTVTQVLPFILVGIGLDDSFILWGAMSETDENWPLMERLRAITDEAGPSILVTSLTDSLAFALGALSTIPGIKWFCFYAVVSILVDFIYQITFFVALIALDQRRIEANRCDCMICFKAGTPKICKESEEDNEREQEKTASRTQTIIHSYTCLLLHPISKFAILSSFTILLVLGAMSASQVQLNFDLTALTPYGSFIDRFYESESSYFSDSGGGLEVGVYFRNIDVSDPHIQDHMIQYVNELVTEVDFIDDFPSHFWLTSFRDFINPCSNCTGAASPDGISSFSFNDQLSMFLEMEPYMNLYKDHIVRDSDSGEVLASRTFLTVHVDMSDASNQVDLLTAQREVTLKQPLNQNLATSRLLRMFTFHPQYPVFEHFRLIPRELITSLLLALTAVAIVSLCFLPNPLGTVLVAIVIFMIDVELIGIIHLAGFHINTITVILLIMSIGLVADFSMHIVHAYILTSSTDANLNQKERINLTLARIGKSVFLGGLSTFLGVQPLALSSSEVFWTFYVMFVSMVLLGLAHGLIFVPVMLSFLRPTLSVDNAPLEEMEEPS